MDVLQGGDGGATVVMCCKEVMVVQLWMCCREVMVRQSFDMLQGGDGGATEW